MKFKNFCHRLTRHRQIISRFGNAWLIQFADHQFKLVGGNHADYLAAKEWASFFAHEVVFGQPEKHWCQTSFHFPKPMSKLGS